MKNQYDDLEKFLIRQTNELVDIYYCNCINGKSSYVKNGKVLALENDKIVLSVAAQKDNAELAVNHIIAKLHELDFRTENSYNVNGIINNYTIYFQK